MSFDIAEWSLLLLNRIFEVDPVGPIAASLGVLAVLWSRGRAESRLRAARDLIPKHRTTGGAAAVELLREAGLPSVRVESGSGWPTDYYDPTLDCLRLAPETFEDRSLAALAIVAHEVGHASQADRRDPPMPLIVRDALAQSASIAPGLLAMTAAVGFVLGIPALLTGGLVGFGLATVLPVVGLPIERDASRRAARLIGISALVDQEGAAVVRRALEAADLTTLTSTLPRRRPRAGRGRSKPVK